MLPGLLWRENALARRLADLLDVMVVVLLLLEGLVGLALARIVLARLLTAWIIRIMYITTCSPKHPLAEQHTCRQIYVDYCALQCMRTCAS